MKNNTTTPEVVVVTGATAVAFGKRGACVGLLARGHAGLEAAKKEFEAAGGKALAIPTDVSDPDQVEAAAQQVEDTFGPIDVWVNDAMESVFSPFKEMKPQDFKRVTEVAYLGFVYGTMTALHHMLPHDKGRIIQIGSALAYRSIPLQSAYCGAKHGIMGFTDSVRCELIHDKSNVKITMVQLPAVNTPQFGWVKNNLPDKAQPVPPIYQPEMIADAVTWVTDHYRRELFIGLSTVIAIQGNKIAPAFADRYLGKTGYKSRQKANPNQPNNLHGPVDEERDYGAHGTFDNKASYTSKQLWLDMHAGSLALAGLGLAGVATFAALTRRLR